MELRHLRYFAAVAAHGSFSRAAGTLHLTQPALSRQVKDLEDELGVPLLVRGTNAVSLTDAGELFYEEARDLLRSEGIETSHLLMKAYPFHPDVRGYIESYERVYVVEQNRDGQMASLLRMDMPDLAPRLRSILHYDGLPIDAVTILDGVRSGDALRLIPGEAAAGRLGRN